MREIENLLYYDVFTSRVTDDNGFCRISMGESVISQRNNKKIRKAIFKKEK